MRDTVIFSGGSTDLCFAAEFMKDKMDALLIAADRGLEALLSLGLKPSAVIGDFDSASEETKRPSAPLKRMRILPSYILIP